MRNKKSSQKKPNKKKTNQKHSKLSGYPKLNWISQSFQITKVVDETGYLHK